MIGITGRWIVNIAVRTVVREVVVDFTRKGMRYCEKKFKKNSDHEEES